MANNAYYSMKIVGAESECREFVKRLKSYDEPNHFWRIFTADVYDVQENGDFALYICGDCAWSLESCCRASGYSNGVDLFFVNTKELNLKLEAYSQEYGIGFEEHYIYDKGDCVLAECIDADQYYWDKAEFDTYEKFIEECPEAPPEEAFDESGYATVGGYGEDFEHWHI